MAKREESIDVVLARVFKSGIWGTASFYATAVLIATVRHQEIAHDARAYPHSPAELFRALLTLEPGGWAYAGTLVLIATPIVAVLAALKHFKREGETRYVKMVVALLVIFVISLAAGFVFGLKV